jgi:hypothetical protein
MEKIYINYKSSIYGLLSGLIGGVILIFLSYDPFRLYYIGGYLLMLTLILTVYFSIFFYTKSKNNGVDVNFWKKVIIGFLAYFMATLTSTINQSYTGRINFKNSVTEYLLIIAIHFAFSLMLSLIFSFLIKNASRSREQSNYS